jgi:DNA-binding XRE family transcriptional regulator
MRIIEIIYGNLLGDSSIRSDKGKYFTYQAVGKDKKFLDWLEKKIENFGIKCWISKNKADLFLLGFYINSCPFPELISLREKWYKQEAGKTIKIIPKDLEVTSNVLLFWYLGDGSLIRRKNDKNRIPFIVLATNSFSKVDLNFLIQKLKELNLNFYPVKYKSGFTGKECGYCLYSNTQDGTPFRFFQFIGFECPKEIKNCSTGKKGIYKEEKFFKNKWPTEEDWIKILSNVKEVANILKEKRKELGLKQKEVAKLVGVCREHARDVENGKRRASVSIFRRVLKALNLDITYLLKELNKNTYKVGG